MFFHFINFSARLIQHSHLLSQLEIKRAMRLAHRKPNDSIAVSIAEEYRLWSTIPLGNSWSDVESWLDEIKDELMRAKMSAEVTMYYIRTKKFVEARISIEYWGDMLSDWIVENEAEARESLGLCTQLWCWHEGLKHPIPNVMYPGDKDAHVVMLGMMKNNGKIWFSLRDARTALMFLDFIENVGDEKTISFYRHSKRTERPPFLPQNPQYDSRFACEIGMNYEIFEDIRKKSIQLNFESVKAHVLGSNSTKDLEVADALYRHRGTPEGEPI